MVDKSSSPPLAECALDGCTRPRNSRAGGGLCRPHYRRKQKHGSPTWEPEPVACAQCSAAFRPASVSAKFCGSDCARAGEKARAKELRELDPNRSRDAARAWRRKNPDYHAAYNKRWREQNREQYLAAAREYRAKNPELVRARFAAWEAKNPRHTSEWTARNREQARETVRRRRARLRGVESYVVTPRDVTRLHRRQGAACAYCQRPLENGYHVDHIVPVSRGGSNGIGNLALACAACNSSKSNWLLSEWRYKDLLGLRKPESTHLRPPSPTQ